MDSHIAAGLPSNEGVLLELRRRKTDPKVTPINKPVFPIRSESRPDYPSHFGWNPVYWSDYPKQPMWTVPLPKMPGPVLSKSLPPFPNLPCHNPPTEWMSLRTCPVWIPDLPRRVPGWNPYVSETNTCFHDLLGPPKF
ncbi:unnamed protein product [Lymnaea stagnalis]|uniref:Uncharacterized protein n=1 Tax=Lymnaea stagnalis TaxID=6523 RepID=A0AAV2H0T7_LYMST